MNEKEIILVTGQSGLQVRQCLTRLPQSRKIISIDHYIKENFHISFPEFLGLEQSLQYEYWNRAFDGIFDKYFNQELSSPVFLTFHAAYYHQQKRELFSPVNFERLSKLKGRVKMLVVFIDDIYDVYRRLMDGGQMFESTLDETKTQPLDAIFKSVFNIISLLNWREMEIALSRAIANLLNIRLFIVATKHPAFMIERLTSTPLDDLKIYYLSHPITVIREEAKVVMHDFVGKLQILIEKILNKSDKIVLFIPTSIDELIIKREKIDKDNYHCSPELIPRWSLPTSNDLLSPPLISRLEEINPLNPLNFRLSTDESDPNSQAISRLLSLLWDFIYKKQVISRDYSLVDQSANGVIACRRNFQGGSTSGVTGELLYNFLLMERQNQRKCFIFSCIEDRNKLSIHRLFAALADYLINPPKELEETKRKWIQDNHHIIDKTEEEVQKEIEKLLPDDYDFEALKGHDPWEGDAMLEKFQRKKDVFKQIYRDIFYDDIALKLDHPDIPNINERTNYMLYRARNFWDEVYKFVDTNL